MHDMGWIILGIVVILGIPSAITYVIVRMVMLRSRGRWLQGQIRLWEEGKIITPDQTDAILSFNKINRAVPKRKIDMIRIITLFGAVFIGIGLIFLVASNWQDIPAHVRTATLLILTIGTLWTGYFLSYENGKYPILGKSLIVLSSILWGATLALIAQIYNLSSDGSWVILILWAAPLLPLTYFLDNEYIYILASVLFGIWNISFSVGKSLPNYYYPGIVFLCLFPLAKKFEKGLALNLVGLLIGAFYAAAMKYVYVPYEIFLGLIVYYLAKLIKPPLTEELFLVFSSVALLASGIGFSASVDFKSPDYIFIIPLVLMFFLSYKNKAKASLGINILNVMVWLNFLIAAVVNTYKLKAGAIASGSFEIFLGVIIYLIGMVHENKEEDKDYGNIYKIFGFMIVFGVLYFLSFNEIHDKEVLKNNFMTNISFALAGLSVLGFVYIYVSGFLKTKQAKLEALAVGLAVIGTAIMLLNSGTPKANVVVANAVLVVIAAVMLFFGMEVQSPKIFNSGVATLILFIATRYMDVFWKLKEKSLFFIVSGILFIAGGIFLEKKRKGIVGRMKDEK